MTEMAWYRSKSGWMVQAPAGRIALDSLRSCESHPIPLRECERCDDGPQVEAGYSLGEYDGAGCPIYGSHYGYDVHVADADYQSRDGSLRVTRREYHVPIDARADLVRSGEDPDDDRVEVAYAALDRAAETISAATGALVSVVRIAEFSVEAERLAGLLPDPEEGWPVYQLLWDEASIAPADE